ncbi:SDR family oxidoreductase [Palleronia sp. LCG004]|uniref:SDR family oxidoreductase n=1 Tax=Palleronia sp. LCG004 TaxID=3079304 RepID=UPI002942671C|nr:SDR family oxidoreductase [Palleronia sp. LCG004]WOI57843.1 SDR family oxidoreductase [Palleronia sp. LCG004]
MPTMIVTGGSRGIGAAVARLAARRGFDVCLGYARDQASADRVAADIRAQGRTALALQVDTGREDDILRLFAECDAALGAPDVVVNNAGITGRRGPVSETTDADLRRVMEVNLVGAFLVAREAIARMSTAKGGAGGSIVNISSRAAELGGAGEWVHYAASKAGMDIMTKGLAREVGPEGIRVNAVRPGLIDTEIHAAAGAPDRVEKLMPAVPMGRAGTADEVAEAVLWLVSDAASYVSGSLVDLGGGR